MQNKALHELWGDLGKLKWWVVWVFIVCICASFKVGKDYGEQGKAGELTACQTQVQRQHSLLLECKHIAGVSLQQSIDAEIQIKGIHK